MECKCVYFLSFSAQEKKRVGFTGCVNVWLRNLLFGMPAGEKLIGGFEASMMCASFW